MKKFIVLATDQAIYTIIAKEYLGEGWVLDPTLTDGKPYRLDTATVWPLVYYESENEKPLVEVKVGEFNDVVDVKDAQFSEVAGLIAQGYVVQSVYAKSTILIKRKVK